MSCSSGGLAQRDLRTKMAARFWRVTPEILGESSATLLPRFTFGWPVKAQARFAGGIPFSSAQSHVKNVGARSVKVRAVFVLA